MLWKKTTVMLIAFGVLTIAAIAVMALPGSGTGPSLNLPALDKESIVKIELTNTDAPVTLEKKGETWRLLPGDKAVEDSKINDALAALSDLKAGAMISKTAENHATYGVGDGAAMVTATAADGTTLKLILGKETSDKRGDYVRAPGDDRVFTTNRRIAARLNKKPDDWRKRQVLSFDAKKAKGLSWTTKGKSYEFAKNDEGTWAFAQRPDGLDPEFELDTDKVDRLVRSLSNLRASEFEDGKKSDSELGFDPPRAKATVTLEEGDPLNLSFGVQNDKNTAVRAAGDDQVYYISQYTADKVLQDLDSLRDLHVVDVELAKATAIKIVNGGKTLAFEKGNDWALTNSSDPAPADFKLDPQKVSNLVRSIERFQGTSLVGKTPPPGSGLASPKGYVSVSLNDGSEHTVKVGAETGEKEIYVQGDEGKVFIVGKFAAEALLKPLERLKVTAQGGANPMMNPEALKNLPPEIAQQLMQKQKQQILQKQMMEQAMKQQQAQQGTTE